MSVSDFIRDIVKELPLSDVLRERLVIAEARTAAVEKENVNLKEENAGLVKRLDEANKELSALRSVKENFVEHRGALFKRHPAGGYHKAVFCISCGKPMSAFDVFPYACDSCQIQLSFTIAELDSVLKDLE